MNESRYLKENIESNILNINPEPIGIYTLPIEKHLDYKKKIQKLWEIANNENIQIFKGEPYTKHMYNAVNQNIFNAIPELSDLKIDIKNIVLDYISKIGFICEDIIVNSAWLNKAEKNSVLGNHSHTNSYVSGNYFVNFNSDGHTPLMFVNDRGRNNSDMRQSISLKENTSKKTFYNIDSLSLKANEGDIIIWRSHMRHGYSTPNKKNERMTLSFNTMPKTLNTGTYTFSVSE